MKSAEVLTFAQFPFHYKDFLDVRGDGRVVLHKWADCPIAHFLTLRSQHTTTMLRTQNVVMEVGYPLTARDRHIQIFYSVVEVH